MSKHSCEADPKVGPCSCGHEQQDQFWGKGRRLHNPCKENQYRCIVCGNETHIGKVEIQMRGKKRRQ